MAAHEAQCSLRSVPCAFCAKLTAADNEASHADVCPLRPAPCHAGCGASVARASLARHLATECPEAEVECPYAGCGARFRRADADAHAESMLGAHLAGERAARVALERRLNGLERRMRGVETSQQRANWAANAHAPPPPPSGNALGPVVIGDVRDVPPPSGRRRAREERPVAAGGGAGFRAVVPRPAAAAAGGAGFIPADSDGEDGDGPSEFVGGEEVEA
jgi:hypothetical protein